MGGFLTEPVVDKVCVGNRRYRVNTAFDIVLEVQRLYREKDLPDILKLTQALKMFGIRNADWLDSSVRAELLNEIYHKCIEMPKRPPGRQKAPVLDFELDGEYIFASFFLDYGIDLVDMQGRLPWKKFIALFQGLSEKSKIREVMRIRSMEIPVYNGHNQKQIQDIMELQSYYALPVKGGGGQSGLDALFASLESMAVKRY